MVRTTNFDCSPVGMYALTSIQETQMLETKLSFNVQAKVEIGVVIITATHPTSVVTAPTPTTSSHCPRELRWPR